VFDCPPQIKGICRRRCNYLRRREPLICQSRCATAALEAYRYRIGIGWQQKIGLSVSVENGVLGLTLQLSVNDVVVWSIHRSSAYTVDCLHPLIHWIIYVLLTESKKFHMRSILCSLHVTMFMITYIWKFLACRLGELVDNFQFYTTLNACYVYIAVDDLILFQYVCHAGYCCYSFIDGAT